MLNLDPNLVDQDSIRHKKRKKLFKIAVLPLIILLLLSLFFLRTNIYNVAVFTSANNYERPKTLTNFQLIGNLIDSSLVYYNRGTLNLLNANSNDDLSNAETDFEESLKHDPPEERLCPIYTNYSYSIELRGDSAFKDKNYNESIVLYNRAESLLYENNCVKKNSAEGKDELATAARDRLAEKRRIAVEAANNITEEEKPAETRDPDEEEIDPQTLQEIQEKQKSKGDRAAGNIRYQFGKKDGFQDFSAPNF